MRPAVVLVILALALAGTMFFGDGAEPSFDQRFHRTQQHIQDLSADIKRDLDRREEQSQ